MKNAPTRVLDLWLDLQTDAATPETVLHGYLHGRFPLTIPETGQIFWKAPDPRGVMPLDGLRVTKNLNRLLRQGKFQVSINRCFDEVVRGCGDREETWITDQIIDLYCELHRMKLAHSFEAWADGELLGGYFGVSLGAYFVGVSQFNRVRDAGKISFIHCHQTLQHNGFLMHDVEEPTPHLESFGCVEVPALEFRVEMLQAVATPCRFDWNAYTELMQTVDEPVIPGESTTPVKALSETPEVSATVTSSC